MIQFCTLASGSNGNMAIIKTIKKVIAIDFGCGINFICQSLECFGLEAKNLDAVFITHAHSDHLSKSGFAFLCKYKIPLYCHQSVWLDICKRFQNYDECNKYVYEDKFHFFDIFVRPFNVYHKDRAVSQNLGYTFESAVAGRVYKIGYLTDTGKITDAIKKILADSNILTIESNYDARLLKESFRPRQNKEWVASDFGHLGNVESAQAICDIKMLSTSKESLKYVFLAHLSAQHNSPEIALNTVCAFLKQKKISDIRTLVAPRGRRGKAIKIG